MPDNSAWSFILTLNKVVEIPSLLIVYSKLSPSKESNKVSESLPSTIILYFAGPPNFIDLVITELTIKIDLLVR